MKRDLWLYLGRYSWFFVVGGLVAGRDACLGGGKRPEPTPAPTPSAEPTFATPPPQPTIRPVPPG